jgi:hypothetical protein
MSLTAVPLYDKVPDVLDALSGPGMAMPFSARGAGCMAWFMLTGDAFNVALPERGDVTLEAVAVATARWLFMNASLR